MFKSIRTFDEIVYQLRNDSRFITEKINKEDFEKYINFIDQQIKAETKPEKAEENDSGNKIKRKIDEQESTIESTPTIREIDERNATSELKSTIIKTDEQESTAEKTDEKHLSILEYQKEALNGNVEAQELLAIKYTKENDTENTNKYLSMLIQGGKSHVPIEYATHLFHAGHYMQAFNYFSYISKSNHPIAKFYIGVMKFYGYGCKENRPESYEILQHLSENGIDRATEFLEDHFEKV